MNLEAFRTPKILVFIAEIRLKQKLNNIQLSLGEETFIAVKTELVKEFLFLYEKVCLSISMSGKKIVVGCHRSLYQFEIVKFSSIVHADVQKKNAL